MRRVSLSRSFVLFGKPDHTRKKMVVVPILEIHMPGQQRRMKTSMTKVAIDKRGRQGEVVQTTVMLRAFDKTRAT